MNEFANKTKIENAYEQVLTVLEKVGIRFESRIVRELFEKQGATVKEDMVLFSRELIERVLASTPKQDYAPAAQKRVVAATPFSNAPFLVDDETGKIRRCNLNDAVKLYQINETSELYECTNPGCADPIGNDAPDQFVAQMAMALKYSEKYPSIGLRATGSNAKDGNVYQSARTAFRLVREFYDTWDEPVMTQGICPNPPMTYDQESLANLDAAIDEGQAISIFPCSLSFMTGPESIMSLVIHDFALSLAGLAYIQLKSPGHSASICEFSTMSDIKTLQPAYGTPEGIFTQVIFYELAKYLKIPCVICGSYGDGTSVDYQAGVEALLTMMLPFQLTEVDEIWCYPGILSGFACGSFRKALLDEETMRYTNRVLRGLDMTIEPNLPEHLAAGLAAGSFLGVGSMEAYRRDHYLTGVFNKQGIAMANTESKAELLDTVDKSINKRISAYEPPKRDERQIKLLQPHLPSLCKF